ncbi:MAG: amino acid racemase [Symploca sp. SIO2E6]|nr:amino acid racemase [Symploca sp. SIO2E6]
MSSQKAWFGIIGGMGTAAGLLFEQIFFRVCNERGVSGDQSYPQWIYFNASQVPDRTLAIKKEAPNCTPYLVKVLEKAKATGVSAVVVTCNSAHYFYEDVYRQVPIPWIHLQKETARYITNTFSAKKVGILATEGTIRTKLYYQALKSYGLLAVEPDYESRLQCEIMNAIYHPEFGIKYTGNQVSKSAQEILYAAVKELDTEVVVAGCTEFSVAFSRMELPVPWVDPLQIAAQVLFELSVGKRELDSL